MFTLLNSVSDEYIRDAQGTYRCLHADAPVQWNDKLRAWIVTGYGSVREALRDTGLSEACRHNVSQMTTVLENTTAFV